MRKYITLILAVFLFETLSFLTSWFVTMPAVNGWYRDIEKSVLTPPDWIFGPVWTVLYALLAIAALRLWAARTHAAMQAALWLFAAQMGINYAWSYVFFGLAAYKAAFVMLAAMVALTATILRLATPHDKTVAALLAPYMAWISFATYLTAVVAHLNP